MSFERDPNGTFALPVTPADSSPAARASQPLEPATSPPSDEPARPLHRFGRRSSYLLARFAAFALDALVLPFAIATFGLAFFQAPVGTPDPLHTQGAREFALLAGTSFGIAFFFSYLCEAIAGTTLGKLLFALAVRRTRGGWAGFGRVFVRRLFFPIDVLLIGPLLALVTPRRQRLGDFVAGTVVARAGIGWLAPLIAVAALAAIGYAQVLFGGGLTSAIGVVAETSTYLPATIATLRDPAHLLQPSAPAPAPAPSQAVLSPS